MERHTCLIRRAFPPRCSRQRPKRRNTGQRTKLAPHKPRREKTNHAGIALHSRHCTSALRSASATSTMACGDQARHDHAWTWLGKTPDDNCIATASGP
jgi:hypothetical protein